jgi:PAS domain S-box-containing protein
MTDDLSAPTPASLLLDAPARAQAERFGAVLRAAVDYAIIGTDAAGVINLFSGGAERMLGWSAAQMVGRATPLVFHDAGEVAARGRELGIEPGFEVFVRAAPETREWTYVRADGSRLRVSLSVAALEEDGRVTGFVGVARDATEQARTAAVLRESEERYRRLSDAAFEGVAVMEDGVIVDANPAYLELVGAPRERVVGRRAVEFTAPEHRETVARAIREGWEHPYETAALRADGTRVPVEVRGRTRAGGRVRVTAVRDLTERKRIEGELRAANAELEALVRSAPLSVVAMDVEGRVTVWNPMSEEIFGWTAGEVIGRPLPYVPDERRLEYESMRARVLAGETIRAAEVVRRRKDGSPVWISVSTTLLYDAAGRGRGVLGISHDVSARKEAEAALRAGEERYRNLVERASDIIYETGLEGHFTYVNPTASRVTGYPRERLLGMRFTELVREDHRPAVLAFYAGQLEAAVASTYLEFPAVTADGREVWIGQNVQLLYHDGEVSGVHAVARDITAQREMERMKDEFVGVVSHELRTPLTSIRGSLGLLESGRLDAAQSRRMLEMAVRNTDRLIRLVGDILDLERLESGLVALERGECDAASLMRASADAVRGMAEEAGVALEVEPAAHTLAADGDRVVQVLVNLLSNAVKFSPPGSTVTLSAAREGGEVVFAVRDRGRGIPPDKLDAVFGRFQQVDKSDSRHKGGTGLGLAICKRIAELHGGRMAVESALGQGSTFRVHLPAAPPSPAAE